MKTPRSLISTTSKNYLNESLPENYQISEEAVRSANNYLGTTKSKFSKNTDIVEELDSFNFRSSIDENEEQSEEEKSDANNFQDEINKFNMQQVIDENREVDNKNELDDSEVIDKSIENEFWEDFKQEEITETKDQEEVQLK